MSTKAPEDSKPVTQEELDRLTGYGQDIKADAERLKERKARLEQELQECNKLEEEVQKLVADKTSAFDTRVDVGCDVLCAAHVPDTSRLYVSVGLGFHVEAALSEVTELVAPRKAHLTAQIADVGQRLADASACIAAFDNSLRLLREDHGQGA
ncbi:hypothetical protein HYH03_000385 [Edaphochlamys debaryana]|uniref:Prefoldin subunit n=1 Tax=Edaphochlamys debaryana TaxID=47281 RepID=A0A835YFD1_9CHLO|nr:hypothetical protein HYH03_000385 [Edaphochlamys debaryana]|eukprot:KAG2501887.1 hypothetical protein HYH03_000385 [Edaphochlamys debaryana]